MCVLCVQKARCAYELVYIQRTKASPTMNKLTPEIAIVPTRGGGVGVGEGVDGRIGDGR